MKGLARKNTHMKHERNTHVKHESTRTYQSNIMTKVKVLEKKAKVKDQCQGHGIKRKVLSE
jgi:hypothetical protein